MCSDVDITVMALQALAKHRAESGVKTAIDKAVNWLAAQQQEDGGFTSINTVNCESTAQTIIALTTLGMDPAAAPFKTETGKTMLDALLYYHLGNGSFAHTENTSGVLTANDIASEQAHLALTAYDRYKQKAAPLYDMSSTERVDRYAPVITTNGLRTCTTNEDTLLLHGNRVGRKGRQHYAESRAKSRRTWRVSGVEFISGTICSLYAFRSVENLLPHHGNRSGGQHRDGRICRDLFRKAGCQDDYTAGYTADRGNR